MGDSVLSANRGKGLMRSEFLTREKGLLFGASLELDFGRDGYFNSALFLAQVRYQSYAGLCSSACVVVVQVQKAAAEAQKQFPGHRVVFIFDNSAIHRARAADALVSGSLNAYKVGGAVPKMRPGWYRDRQGTWHEQSLLDKQGEMRPMKSLLEERGLYQPDMDKAAMAAVLPAQPDFIEQRTLVEELLDDLGHGCLFLPKCHCEMNPIELVWSAAKRYCRKHCKYSLKALRATIPGRWRVFLSIPSALSSRERTHGHTRTAPAKTSSRPERR